MLTTGPGVRILYIYSECETLKRRNKMTYEKAIEMGGKDWNGKRVYFSTDESKAALYGITIKGKDGYKDGEKISRSNLFKITASKPYFDIASGEVKDMAKLARCVGFATV